MKGRVYQIIVFGFVLTIGLVFMQTPADAADHDIIAEVNGAPITEGEFLGFARQVADRYKQSLVGNPDLLKQILDTYIERKLILDNAAKQNIEATEGFDEALLRFKEGLIVETFITKLQKDLVTDALILERYNEQKAAHSPKMTYHAKHILVASEDEAKEIINLLKNPENDFGTLARERSRDPSAQSNQGDLGYFDAATMVPEFSAAVKILEKGELSPPVKTQFGWHVITLIDHREEPFVVYEAMKDQIADDILSEKFKAFLDDAKASSTITYHDMPTVQQ